MEITIKQINEIIEAGYEVTIIINGEFYTYKKEEVDK